MADDPAPGAAGPTPDAATDSTADVLVERAGAVAFVRLNRPRALNALTVAAKESLLAALREVSADPEVRAVVLTGTGRAFSVGQDLREHLALLDAGDPTPMRTVAAHYNPITETIASMPKPTVAAVNGVAAGAGAGFAFACDFRVMAESASFLLAFAGVGLSLDSGVSWTLPRLIGSARATAMALLAEPVPAASALEMGLANVVVPDDEVAEAAATLAGRLATGPTAAYAAIKEALSAGATSTLSEALALEDRLQSRSAATADHVASTRAFVAKQRPTFTGR